MAFGRASDTIESPGNWSLERVPCGNWSLFCSFSFLICSSHSITWKFVVFENSCSLLNSLVACGIRSTPSFMSLGRRKLSARLCSRLNHENETLSSVACSRDRKPVPWSNYQWGVGGQARSLTKLKGYKSSISRFLCRLLINKSRR